MKERIDNYIQCPKCLKRLILKKRGGGIQLLIVNIVMLNMI